VKSSRPRPWPRGHFMKSLVLAWHVKSLVLALDVRSLTLVLVSNRRTVLDLLDNWLPHNNFNFFLLFNEIKVENLNKKRLHLQFLHCYLLGSSSSFIIIFNYCILYLYFLYPWLISIYNLVLGLVNYGVGLGLDTYGLGLNWSWSWGLWP
jgi:hypothetical protein